MQPVLERGSIDKPLTFDVGFIQVSFHIYQSVHLIHATFQSNCAQGLHFSAFIVLFVFFVVIPFFALFLFFFYLILFLVS